MHIKGGNDFLSSSEWLFRDPCRITISKESTFDLSRLRCMQLEVTDGRNYFLSRTFPFAAQTQQHLLRYYFHEPIETSLCTRWLWNCSNHWQFQSDPWTSTQSHGRNQLSVRLSWAISTLCLQVFLSFWNGRTDFTAQIGCLGIWGHTMAVGRKSTHSMGVLQLCGRS